MGEKIVFSFQIQVFSKQRQRPRLRLRCLCCRAVDFGTKLLNFFLQALVFFELSIEESAGDAGFGRDASGRQLVDVGGLVCAVAEVLDFDPTLSDHRLEAVVSLAQAQTQLPGHLALGDFRILFEQGEDLVTSRVVHFFVFVLQMARRARGADTLPPMGELPQA